MTTQPAPAAPSVPPAVPATPAPAAAVAPKADPPTWRPARSGWLTVIVLLLVMVGGVLAVLAAWRLPPFTSPVQATEDAYVQGHTTVISPEVSGYVMTVPVEDYQQVHAGQVLVTIDPRTYQQQLARAEAQLASTRTALANNEQSIARGRADIAAKTAAIGSAQAQVRRADAEARRTRDLVRDGSVSPRENEANVATLSSARAALAQAEAALQVAVADLRSTEVNVGSLQASIQGAEAEVASAQLQVSRTEIRAPVDGQLSDIGVKIGQYVTNGTELFFLIPPSRWVIANFKEAETHGMRPGQRAWFHVDALGGSRIEGRVNRMSPATGSQFSVLKPDNATGNFTKVPQRISVYISIDPDQLLADRLKPGMSVEAMVDTAS